MVGEEDEEDEEKREETSEKKAPWGKRKKMYYSADNVDYEVSMINDGKWQHMLISIFCNHPYCSFMFTLLIDYFMLKTIQITWIFYYTYRVHYSLNI